MKTCISACEVAAHLRESRELNPSVFEWHTVVGGREFNPIYSSGYLVRYQMRDCDSSPLRYRAILWLGAFRDACRSVYLLDTEDRVVPFYVAGWSATREELYLHEFPSFEGWFTMPRKAWHLKVKQV